MEANLWAAPRLMTHRVYCCAMLSRFTGILLLMAASAAAGTSPPSAATHGVHLEKTSIRMKDGVRLAVTLYMPADLKPAERCPALLEYLPYRKDDDEAARDYGTHTYFARRGYVSARVDIRGFGASDGAPPDREYSAQEQQDAEEVIAWLAHRSWSNGKVGMLGISWGGFNSIQMALRKPPALKAILAVAATEELFKEDVHYMDGVFHVDEFELTMDLDQGRPGAPDFSLEESVIGPRMDSPPWSLNYMKRPAAADRDAGRARVLDRRPAGRIPRQHSAHAGKGESAAQGLDRPVEPRLSERQRLWAAV
jgi:predicted acyl esterase